MKSSYGFEVNACGRWRICLLLQTAELDRQVPADTCAGARESLEVEEYQHFFSSQRTVRSMGCFMVCENTANRVSAVIYSHFTWSSLSMWSLSLSCLSFYLRPQMVEDLISSHSLLSHSLVAVSTGDTLALILTFTLRVTLNKQRGYYTSSSHQARDQLSFISPNWEWKQKILNSMRLFFSLQIMQRSVNRLKWKSTSLTSKSSDRNTQYNMKI